MSKSLRNIKTDEERLEVVKRRLKEKKMGLGFWAATDYKNKKEKK